MTKQCSGVHLPCFATSPKAELFRNVVVTFHLSFLFETPTTECQLHTCRISPTQPCSDELHRNIILSLRHFRTSGRLHAVHSTEM